MIAKLRIPPVYTLIAIVAAAILNALPVLRISSPLVGSALALAGFLLAAWAAVTIWRHRTPIHPGETPSALVTAGLFRLNRNPIYTGMVLITLGVGVAKGSLLGILPAAVLWWLLDRHFAAPEEERLVETFGDRARDYVARVRRW